MKTQTEVTSSTKLTKENAVDIFEEFQDQLIVSVNAIRLPREYDLALQLSDHFTTNMMKPNQTQFRSVAYMNAFEEVRKSASKYEDKQQEILNTLAKKENADLDKIGTWQVDPEVMFDSDEKDVPISYDDHEDISAYATSLTVNITTLTTAYNNFKSKVETLSLLHRAHSTEKYDIKKWEQQTRLWNSGEGLVIEKITALLDPTLKKVFTRVSKTKGSYHGWQAVLKEINYDRENRINKLRLSITNMKQSGESDRDYVDRAYDLLEDYNSFGKTIGQQYNSSEFVKSVRQGFKRFDSISKYLKSRGAWDNFAAMRSIITEDHNERLVALQQQGINPDLQRNPQRPVNQANQLDDQERDIQSNNTYQLKGNNHGKDKKANCECGMFTCESIKLGWCPDCRQGRCGRKNNRGDGVFEASQPAGFIE